MQGMVSWNIIFSKHGDPITHREKLKEPFKVQLELWGKVKFLEMGISPEKGQNPINEYAGWLNALMDINEFAQQGLKLGPGDGPFRIIKA